MSWTSGCPPTLSCHVLLFHKVFQPWLQLSCLDAILPQPFVAILSLRYAVASLALITGKTVANWSLTTQAEFDGFQRPAKRIEKLFCQQSAARDGKQRGGFWKSVPRRRLSGICRLVAPHVCRPWAAAFAYQMRSYGVCVSWMIDKRCFVSYGQSKRYD